MCSSDLIQFFSPVTFLTMLSFKFNVLNYVNVSKPSIISIIFSYINKDRISAYGADQVALRWVDVLTQILASE